MKGGRRFNYFINYKIAHIKTINHCQLDKRTHNARMRTAIDSIEKKLMEFRCEMTIVHQEVRGKIYETKAGATVNVSNKNIKVINSEEVLNEHDVV